MNRITASLVATLAVSASAFAGTEMQTDTKDLTPQLTTTPIFKDHELQSDSYLVYSVGNGPVHVGLFRDHSFGDGSGINYYFCRYVGLGVEYGSGYTKQSPDTNFGIDDGHHITTYNVGGSVFFRYPSETLRLAPYAYVGGGAYFENRKWGSAHVGVGLEYRLIPGRLGLFVDGRFTYLGDRGFPAAGTHDDLNFFSVRSGIRIVYW